MTARIAFKRPAADQRRRDLAAIHLMAAKLGLDTADKSPQSDYRQMLQTQGGKTSAADLDAAGIKRVLAHLRKSTNPGPRPRDGWQAELIRKLWAQLAEMGALTDPTEHGLNKFVLSQTGIAAPRFLPTTAGNRIVETLKSWVKREAAKKKQAAAS